MAAASNITEDIIAVAGESMLTNNQGGFPKQGTRIDAHNHASHGITFDDDPFDTIIYHEALKVCDYISTHLIILLR